MPVSDLQINTRVRSILVTHWVDVQSLKFGSCRGVVRLTGTMQILGDQVERKIDVSTLETIEAEILRIPGVQRVYLDLANWKKKPTKGWTRLRTTETDKDLATQA